MLRIVTRGPDTYLLLAEDHGIAGWIRGRIVRLTGFESRAAATAADVAGDRALATYYARSAALATGPAAARPPSVDDRSRARLVPPRAAHAIPVVVDVHACGSGRAPGDSAATPTYAIEFMLPEGLRAGACGTIAQVLHAALRHEHRERGRHRRTRVV